MENHAPSSLLIVTPPLPPPVGYASQKIQPPPLSPLTSHLLYLLPVYLVDGGEESKESNPTKGRQFCVLSNLLLREWRGGGGGGEVLCPFHSDFQVLGTEGRARSHKGMSPQRRGL
jgi:hypothetical protein